MPTTDFPRCHACMTLAGFHSNDCPTITAAPTSPVIESIDFEELPSTTA